MCMCMYNIVQTASVVLRGAVGNTARCLGPVPVARGMASRRRRRRRRRRSRHRCLPQAEVERGRTYEEKREEILVGASGRKGEEEEGESEREREREVV